MMDWSNMLPDELFDIVAQKHNLFYEEYLSFTGVSRYWKSAAVEAATKRGYPNGPPSRFPSLMLAEKKEEEVVRELYNLSNKIIRKVPLPEASGKICMSSCGWLLTVGADYSMKLLHPLSRETIILPKISTFPNFMEDSEWDHIRKLVLPLPSLLVVVLWGCSGKIGFCRPGDKTWTAVLDGWAGQIFDITYHNGLVYSFDSHHYIRECDVFGKNPTTMVGVSKLPVDFYIERIGGAYIVGSKDNGLFVIVREGLYDRVEVEVEGEMWNDIYKTESFQVFKYDLQSEKWSKVKDLGRKALFVGYSSSFWADEDTEGVIKGNCIYFTDDASELYFRNKKGGGRDMGIYHLCDGTIEPHFTGESCSHLTPPIWLQPV